MGTRRGRALLSNEGSSPGRVDAHVGTGQKPISGCSLRYDGGCGWTGWDRSSDGKTVNADEAQQQGGDAHRPLASQVSARSCSTTCISPSQIMWYAHLTMTARRTSLDDDAIAAPRRRGPLGVTRRIVSGWILLQNSYRARD